MISNSLAKQFSFYLAKIAGQFKDEIKESSLQVETTLSVLPEVLQWFEQFNIPPLTDKLWMNCQLVLAEGFTNVVRHAHINLPPTTPIHIQVILFKQYLVMRIWDYGPLFNLESKLRSVSLDDPLTQEGGRGLKWIKMLTDQTYYIRTPDGRNCLVMLTKIN